MTLKERVKKSGLKQTYIAEKVGVTPAMLSMYISGKKNLDSEKKRMFEKILKTREDSWDTN